MARFTLQLPDEVIADFQRIYDDAEKIFGEMTTAGAEVVKKNIESNVPASFRKSNIMKCLKITRVYKTPTDDGINTKTGFYGYFVNEKGKKTPAPLVANMFEYGTTKKNYPKKPFMRKSFRKADIERAMLEAQKKSSGGLLDDE